MPAASLGSCLAQSTLRSREASPSASAVFLVSVSSFPECENFIAHYLLGCDEVTDDLLGAKNCVSTVNALSSALQSCQPPLTTQATNKENWARRGPARARKRARSGSRSAPDFIQFPFVA